MKFTQVVQSLTCALGDQHSTIKHHTAPPVVVITISYTSKHDLSADFSDHLHVKPLLKNICKKIKQRTSLKLYSAKKIKYESFDEKMVICPTFFQLPNDSYSFWNQFYPGWG